MKTAVTKLEVKDVEKLHALVIENAEGLEPGLVVLDYRLLLGHATIDAVARDASGSLVLMAIGFTADEEMLLKAVEAYSWCLEYPDAIRRLYTGVELSEARPPRLVFVIERMPDSFHRKMKQLGFPDVDCVEFRLLDVNGVAAVYFERLARLRRTSISEAGARPATSSPASAEPAMENVVTLGASQRAATSRLQKLLTQANVESVAPRPVERAPERTNGAMPGMAAPARDVAPVVSMISRASVAPVVAAAVEPATQATAVIVAPVEPEPEQVPIAVAQIEEPLAVVAAEPEPIPLPEPILAPEPIVLPEPIPLPVTVNEVKSEAQSADNAARFDGLPALELAGPSEPKPAPALEAIPRFDAAPPLELRTETVAWPPTPTAAASSVETTVAAVAPIEPPVAPEIAPAPMPVIEPTPEPIAFRQVVQVAEPKLGTPAPEAKRVSFAEAAAKALLQQTRPGAPAQVEEITRAAVEQVAATPRQEASAAPAETKPAAAVPGFEGLQFPGDGQLTRQWMEFLNQMAAAKK